MRSKGWTLVLVLLYVTLGFPHTGLAQRPDTDKGGGSGISLSLADVFQFDTDIADSRFEVSRYLLKADKNLVISRKMILKLGISWQVDEYSFSGPSADPWSDPFKTVQKAGAGLNAILPTKGNWGYFLAGTLNWSGEEGADSARSLVHGIIVSASYDFRRDRRLGFGMGMFEGLEERKIFPYALVSWSLNEKWSLMNPLRVGPAGPAGLELVYDARENWQVAGGAAYRSSRFRLDDEGTAPGGIGEMKGVPAWVRASWQASPKLKLDVYGGAILAGKAKLEDSGGRRLESDSYNTAPLAAVTLKASF
jgi:hypothetical protein